MDNIDNYYVIGMSPGNSYFGDEEVEYLLKTLIEKFSKVLIMVADVPAISTYVGIGYPENRARREKAIPQGNLLKNKVKRIMETKGYTDNQVRILDWKNEVENNNEYQEKYNEIKKLFDLNGSFRKDALDTTKKVIENKLKPGVDIKEGSEIAVHYLLSEFAFLEFAPKYLSVKKVTYVYHKNWFIFEKYISGKYDGVEKKYLSFLLWENPWETFRTLGSMGSISKDKKILKAGFSNYPPIFYYDKNEKKYDGFFYEIIKSFAEKFNYEIVFSEETGYGVIQDGLNSGRIDIFASPVWPTLERKEELTFSNSLFESEVYIYISEENQFESLENKSVVVKQKDISESLANEFFSDNRKVFVPQLSEPIEILSSIVEMKGDFTFAEESLANIYNENNKVKVVKFTEKPIKIYDNCFALGKNNQELKEKIDIYILEMKTLL